LLAFAESIWLACASTALLFPSSQIYNPALL
jgi:hypothetical protein